MRQLRPQIPEPVYLETVRRMMKNDGYLQAAVFEGDTVVAVAGYRFMEMLFSGKSLYVDDLNTDETRRSRGHGKTLMDWRSEEHTSELQSQSNLVCRLLLEKKKKNNKQ